MCGLVSLTPLSASAVPLARPRREMPRLFFDEPLSEALCKALADIFPSSLHVRLLGQGGAADATVWDLARQHRCLVVSKERRLSPTGPVAWSAAEVRVDSPRQLHDRRHR